MKRDTLGTLRARIAEATAELVKIGIIAQKFKSDGTGLTLASLFAPSQFVELLVDRLGEVQRRAEVAEAALTALVHKLDEVHADERYQAVWFSYVIHGGNYTGPKYEVELHNARVVVEGQTNAKS